MIIGPIYTCLIQPPFGAGVHEVEGLCTEAHHQGLTFRVAETHIVFNQTWRTVFDHEANVKNPLIGCPALCHLLQCRSHNFAHCTVCDGFRQHRGRGIGSHAACVWASVTFADTFVILSRADRQRFRAMAKHKERGFLTLHEFFDDNFRPRSAEGTVEHVINRGCGFIQRHRHDHTFTGCQPIRFHDDGRPLFNHIGFGRSRIRKSRPSRGRRTRCVTDFLGKTFGRFQCGRGLRWSKH